MSNNRNRCSCTSQCNRCSNQCGGCSNQSNKEIVVPKTGLSAYQSFKKYNPNTTLTEKQYAEEYLKGSKGDRGEDGNSINVKGSVDTYALLPTEGLTVGDTYAVADEGKLYVYGQEGFPPQGQGIQVEGEKGDNGESATVQAGQTTTTSAGSQAKVINVGTSLHAILDFEIPQGLKGDKGDDSFITCNSIEDIRNLTSEQIGDLITGKVSRVKLLGYYRNLQYATPIDYYLSSEDLVDDGGGTIKLDSITLHHPFDGEVNVNYYGVYTHIEDNLPNITKLLNSYNIAFFPKNPLTYKVSNNIILRDNQQLKGEGLKLSVIEKTTINKSGVTGVVQPSTNVILDYDIDCVVMVLHQSGRYCEGVSMRDIGIMHTQSLYNSHPNVDGFFGIFSPFCNFLTMTNVETNWSGIGIFSQSTWMASFKDCYFRGNRLGGVKMVGGTSNTFTSCWSAGCTKFAWWIGAVYSNLISCGADSIGVFPQTDPNTAPADYIYRISAGVNLINCATEQSKGTIIYNVGSNTYPSNVVGFYTDGWHNSSTQKTCYMVEAVNNAQLNIIGGRINASGAVLTGKNVRVDSGSYVKFDNTFLFPAITSSTYELTSNSALTWGDASGYISKSVGNNRMPDAIDVDKPIRQVGNYQKALIKLQQNSGHFAQMCIWQSSAVKGMLRFKAGNTSEGLGIPSSDTDGLILTSVTDRGTTAQRPTQDLLTGYTYFDTTLGKPIWYRGSGGQNWVDSTGASV